MKTAFKAVAYPFLCVSLTAALVGCSSRKPETEDFSRSIAESTGGYDIKDVRCESFANQGQEKSGRASCRGTLAVMFDLYAPMSDDDVRASLVSAGIPREGGAFFFRRHPKTIFTRSVAQGTETPFSAECSYSGDVDGWNTGCSTTYQRFSGQPLGTIGDGVIRGSAEHTAYVNEVLGDYRRLDAAFLEVKNGIERFFSTGRTLSNGPGTIRAAMVSPLVWTGERGFLGYQSAFHMEAKYQDRRDNTTSTFCGYPKGTPRDDIRFDGTIGFARDRSTGQETFPAYVQMSDRASQFQNRFFGCGNRLRWDGSAFRGGYSGTAELRSE